MPAYSQGFPIDDRPIGRPDVHYLDPEFIDMHGQHKVLFTDQPYSTGKLWVADLDPVTGDFVSGHGTENVLDTGIAPLYETIINGPEWGADRNGLALFYTKYDVNKRKQIWRAELSNLPVLTQLTNDTLDNVHWAATLNPTDASMIFFLVRYFPAYGPILFWTNENNVSYDHPILGYVWPGNNGPRFIPGTSYFVYSKQTSPNRIELVQVNTADGTERIITNDGIKKVDTWGFIAPEFNNEICYSACTSDTTIGIYRYLSPSDPFATLIATIKPPEGHPLKYISSIEILQTGEGRFDKTYFAFRGAKIAQPLIPSDGAMWIASLGSDPAFRFVRRVDIGAVTGDTAYRQEPELLIGRDEVFLYYNSYNEGGIKELRRCRTGIFPKTTSVSSIPPQSDFVLFPNPTVSSISMEQVEGPVGIHDMLGRQVWNGIADGRISIDVSGLPRGIYVVQTRKMTTRLVKL